MHIIFLFSIVLHFILSFAYVYFLIKKVSNRAVLLFGIPVLLTMPIYFARVLSPLFIADDELLPYVIVSFVADCIFNFVQFLVFCYIFKAVFKSKLNGALVLDFKINEKNRMERLVFISKFFLVLGIAFLILLAESSGFGLLNWLQNPRLGYQMYRTGNGHFWIGSQVFLGLSLVCFCFGTKGKYIAGAWLLIIMGVTYFLGSKLLIINEVAFFIGWWAYRFGFSFSKLIMFAAPLFILLMFNFFGSGSTEPIRELLEYFDYYINSALYYREYFSGKLPLYYGDIYFGELWGLVPRVLYSGKPFVYGSFIITDYFYPGTVEAGHYPAFAGHVSEFADFGFIGLVVLALFDPSWLCFSFVTALVVKLINENKINNGSYGYLIILYFSPNFWYFFRGINGVVAFFMFLMVFYFFRIMKFKVKL